MSYVHEHKFDSYFLFYYDHLVFVDRNIYHLNILWSILVSHIKNIRLIATCCVITVTNLLIDMIFISLFYLQLLISYGHECLYYGYFLGPYGHLFVLQQLFFNRINKYWKMVKLQTIMIRELLETL